MKSVIILVFSFLLLIGCATKEGTRSSWILAQGTLESLGFVDIRLMYQEKMAVCDGDGQRYCFTFEAVAPSKAKTSGTVWCGLTVGSGCQFRFDETIMIKEQQ